MSKVTIVNLRGLVDTIVDEHVDVNAVEQAVIDSQASADASEVSRLASETAKGISFTNATQTGLDVLSTSADVVTVQTLSDAVSTLSSDVATDRTVVEDLRAATTLSQNKAATSELEAKRSEEESLANAIIAFNYGQLAESSSTVTTTKAAEALASSIASELSAQASAVSAAEALNHEGDTLTLYNDFNKRYLGPKAVNPTLDEQGQALGTGALYLNTTDDSIYYYTGTIWIALVVPGSGASLMAANNLSDLVDVIIARQNLGVEIDVNVQSYDANTVIDSAYVHTDNSYTTAEKTKLSGIEANATADQTKADIDALGIDASTVNGLTVQSSVPSGASFTDTVYDDTTIQSEVDLNTAKVSNATHTGDVTGSTALTIKDSVTLGGSPTTTTQTVNDSSTKVATTEFVLNQINNMEEA